MLLEVQDLNVYYGAIHALQGVTFTVDEGEIVTLIGANGAGKSTTLKTISGLLRPRAGTVRLRGEEIVRTPAQDIVRLGIVHVPEGRKIFAPLTVQENLEMGAFTRSDPAEIKQSMERVFQSFPAPERALRAVWGHAVGRRAADAGHRPWAHGPTQNPLAGRAFHGPGAHPGRRNLQYHQGDQ